ncbi:hypothetical protein GCM10023194_66660 [Planotetraspora phitsanulokensis]|uniref:HTH arsR-type domain-containing protein n=1 Tax=Planotetraspora phitsanulokensis TaxID=575192 RepID=A0A8J3XFJ7_9ACTN|nr:winged helix-turn-helix domain-containing protein [Planotetraspora phitsanulokensis]GII39772.1 hypothetical protein Pph01_47750 [Planotetraspora phitsanulokensis]
MAEDGIQQVFAHLHPALHWSGDRLVSPDLPAADPDLNGAGITRAVGTLWEARDATGNGLARLIGRSRAQLLAYTTSPTTTTQLAARTGLSLGTVSQHLTVLREAGLVTSHRYRHEVNYTTSDLGIALLERS